MAIIKDQMQRVEAPAQAQPTQKVDLRSQMKVPPGKEGQLDALVKAGSKLMYSEALDQHVQELLQSEGPIGEALGQGVLGLLAIVWDRSNGSIPQELLIPAGVLLVPEAADYVRELGRDVSQGDEAEGVAVFVEGLLERAGVSPDQLPQLLGGQPQQGAPA